ncbi:MAG TPA: carbon monoxide dehydrogenase subunit G [Azospirillaceae bacterium]|nr:carbon monoxide dehydrogenase subunit G [Azospirillaceae bacterium]
MDLTGEYRIPAPRERVWAALNDPDVLRQCIAGCESLEKVSDTELTAKVRAKVGPVSATFSGKVTLSDLDPPAGYRISGEGTGGAAGFAKGGAAVALVEDGPDATVLRYNAEAQVGGKLAQIGSRLIQGTAKKMADDFFTRFANVVAGPTAAGTAPAEAGADAEPTADPAVVAAAAAIDGAPPGTMAAAVEAAPEPSPAPGSSAVGAATMEDRSGGVSPVVWIGGLVVAVAVVLLLVV